MRKGKLFRPTGHFPKKRDFTFTASGETTISIHLVSHSFWLAENETRYIHDGYRHYRYCWRQSDWPISFILNLFRPVLKNFCPLWQLVLFYQHFIDVHCNWILIGRSLVLVLSQKVDALSVRHAVTFNIIFARMHLLTGVAWSSLMSSVNDVFLLKRESFVQGN